MFLDLDTIGPDGLRFDQGLRLPDLDGLAGERLAVRDVRLRGDVSPAKRGMDLHAHLDATVHLACGRCLEAYAVPISTDFWLSLVSEDPSAGPGAAAADDSDLLLFFCRDGKADLLAIASEQIYLHLPLKPVCRQTCRGLCPSCGANRNATECGCRVESIDPRLAPLLDLKNRLGGS